jgi:hypothetical protein
LKYTEFKKEMNLFEVRMGNLVPRVFEPSLQPQAHSEGPKTLSEYKVEEWVESHLQNTSDYLISGCAH